MSFKIGDKVSVLDKNIKGKILSLTSHKVIILDEDGFEELCFINKLVLLSSEDDYEKTFDKIPLNKEIKETKITSKKNIAKKVREIDLHMENLSGSIKGMTNHEIVMYQLNAVEKALRDTDKRYFYKIVFIHGKGKGKLRYELEMLLRKKNILFQDASFKLYGRGAIEALL